MKILADYHHSDLFESYGLTFEDRFGWKVYRPIGMEWFEQDYWQFERAMHGDAVAKQYLSIWDTDRDCGDHWEREDTTHPGRVHKMVTVEQARSQPWDVVMASVPHNEQGLHRFAQEVGAHFGVQIGNVGQAYEVVWPNVEFALCATTMPFRPDVPAVIYRQEFSLKDFRYDYPPTEKDSIASFVQCFAENKGMARGEFYDQWERMASGNSDFWWKVYGAYGSQPEDQWACGNLGSTPDVAKHMRACRMAWHAKFWSDGYGHVIHNLHAVGRPIFSYHNYYADKLAAPLMEHGVTGFDLSRLDEGEILTIARRLRDDDSFHHQISEQTAARFREVVDFDADAQIIKRMFEKVL